MKPLLETSITKNAKAVIVVHPCKAILIKEAIVEICRKHNLYLIEDCVQSHFLRIQRQKLAYTALPDHLVFTRVKNLGAYGDAGCIITNDDTLAEKCRMYANHGALVKHQHRIEGINSRFDGLQAAILSAKLPHS